jgi:hypothetical protein
MGALAAEAHVSQQPTSFSVQRLAAFALLAGLSQPPDSPKAARTTAITAVRPSQQTGGQRPPNPATIRHADTSIRKTQTDLTRPVVMRPPSHSAVLGLQADSLGIGSLVRDTLLIATAATISVSILLLLVVVSVLHRRQLKQLRALEHPAADQLLAAARTARDAALAVQNQQVAHFDRVMKAVVDEVDCRLRILERADDCIRRLRAAHLRVMADVNDNYRPADGDVVTLVCAQHNLELIDRIADVTAALREADESVKKSITRGDSQAL